MAIVSKDIVINAPAEKVFGYLADFPRHSEWASQRLQIEQTSDGPVGQGTTFASVGHQFGEQHDTVTVTEFSPNSQLTFECEGNAGLIRHGFSLAEQDGGTKVSKSFEPLRTAGVFKLLSPVVSAFIAPGAMAKDLANIKARVEEAG